MLTDPASGRLPITGLYNARDLGGMPLPDGKKTAFHKLVRSDAPDHLDRQGIEELASYGVSVVIDLRSYQEAETHPDSILSDPRFTYYNIPLLRIDADDIKNDTIRNTIDSSLGDLYIWMLGNAGPYFAEVLRVILKETPRTVLFHCAHGKDRTGLIAAFFYLLCDASREDVIRNYAISYEYVRELVAPLIAKTPENVHHIYRSDAINMERLLAHLYDRYPGGIREYLLSIGLSNEEIGALSGILQS